MSDDLIRAAARQMARHAIDELATLLKEADGYLDTGNDMAAWGTLLMFDDAASDLKAAMQLHRSANRKGLALPPGRGRRKLRP